MRIRKPKNAAVNITEAASHVGILDEKIVQRPISALKPFADNPRQHGQKQLHLLTTSIATVGFANPIIIDETRTILCGHGRAEAARRLGLRTVPTVTLRGLSSAHKLAYVIADNKLGDLSAFDPKLLQAHVLDILENGIDIEVTGFTTGEADLIIDGQQNSCPEPDPETRFLN